MISKLPIIELDEFQRLWLQEVYDILKKEKRRAKNREVWSKLYGRLPKNFRPANIDPLVINASGEDITLLGIVALEKNYDIIVKGTEIINTIKEMLLNDSDTNRIEIRDVSFKCKLSPEETGLILYLANRYGFFYDSASLETDTNIIKSLEIGRSDQCYHQYLFFEDLSKLIFVYLNEQKKNSASIAIEEKVDQQKSFSTIEIKPIFNSKVDHVNTGLCFVLMPFTEKWSDRVYKLIKKNVEELGLQCLRADNLNGTIIIEDIWTSINQAAIIIADVTNRNANVMYEMGIVHTLGKPCILMTQDVENVPFDFKHLRHNPYEDNADSFKSFGKKLKEIIKDLHSKNYPNAKQLI